MRLFSCRRYVGSSTRNHAPAAKLRVLVVEDSLTVRKHIVETLRSDPGLEVVGEAGDAGRAIELCGALRPDVVTMDMSLAGTSGLAATEHIMAHFPTPILIVSASTNRAELFRTYDALAAGAVDVLEKPAPGVPEESWQSELISRVRMTARIRVITHLRGRISPLSAGIASQERPRPPEFSSRAARPCVVALGASTGGPAAIREILRGLSPEFDLPILLVFHLAPAFAGAFAEWLGEQLPMPVGYAEDGAPLPPAGSARVVIAPPERHLVLRRGRLRLTSDPERHSCRPSVDVLFESLAEEVGEGTAACLLTGMGKDGARGLLAVRQAGGTTLAQDEASCVVFGMPGEAVRIGAAGRVLPLSRFSEALSSLAAAAESGARLP
jgi:two-component system chemotaxis response regulator CheB